MSKDPTIAQAPTPRTIDPAIAKLRAEAKAKVEEYRKQQKSAEILTRIVEKDLPKMTIADIALLRGEAGTYPKSPTKATP